MSACESEFVVGAVFVACNRLTGSGHCIPSTTTIIHHPTSAVTSDTTYSRDGPLKVGISDNRVGVFFTPYARQTFEVKCFFFFYLEHMRVYTYVV